MKSINGNIITDFSGNHLELPASIINGNPELIAYYASILDNGAGGALENEVARTLAALTGGSTHADAQIKFWDNFQRLKNTDPFPLGYRASAATVNLDHGLANGSQSVSAEVDASAGDHTATNGGITVISTDSVHGSHCFRLLATGAVPTFDTDLTGVTAASTQYLTQARVKVIAPSARTIRCSLIGDTSGATNEDFAATGDWQLVTCLKTFAAGDTTSRERSISLTNGVADDVLLVDSLMTTEGATPLPFTTQEATATTGTVPTPFSAGEAFSALMFFWVPSTTSATGRYLFENTGTDGAHNRVYAYIRTDGFIFFYVLDNAGNALRSYIDASAIITPASLNGLAISRNAAGVQNAVINGTTFTTRNNGAGTGLESVVAANTYLGSYSTAGSTRLNGFISPFFYRGVAWGDDFLKMITDADYLAKKGIL